MRDDHHADVDRLIDDTYLATSRAATELVQAHAAQIVDRLDWRGEAEQTPAEAARSSGVEPSLLGPFLWLLEEAAAGGWLRRTPRETGRPPDRFARTRKPSGTAVRAALEAARDAELDLGCTPEMTAYVAERYPEFLRGERSGASVLLKPPGLDLWERYFSSRNPLYDVHNQLAARGVARLLDAADRPLELLELGAGTGGGTAALLQRSPQRLPDRIRRLTISDVAPSFLVRIAERLGKTTVEVRRKRADFNAGLAQQGFPPGSADVVVAVNALHNARDLGRTLEDIAALLSPGGTLLISESLCQDGHRVHQEVIFNLLPGLRGDARAGELRSRFLCFAEWQAALEASPFEASLYRNTAGPELALLAFARKRP